MGNNYAMIRYSRKGENNAIFTSKTLSKLYDIIAETDKKVFSYSYFLSKVASRREFNKTFGYSNSLFDHYINKDFFEEGDVTSFHIYEAKKV